MKSLCRIVLLSSALAWAPLLSAQEIKIATLAPDGSTWMNELRQAAERIQSGSEQRVRLRFYPGGVMGDANAVLRRMRLGQLQGGAFTVGDLGNVSPAVNLYSLPFLFQDEDEVLALREQFDPLILSALEEAGLVVPAISLAGFAYLFSREAIPAPEQLSTSWRVWVPATDVLSRRTLEQAGVSPVPLPLADVYTALQTGTINTFASTPSGAIILQWHSRSRHMLDLPILMTGGTIGLDARFFNRLQAADRELVLAEFRRALNELEAINRRDNAAARQALSAQGIRINPADAAHAAAWQDLARRTRSAMLASGQLEIPQLDQLETALERMRGAD